MAELTRRDARIGLALALSCDGSISLTRYRRPSGIIETHPTVTFYTSDFELVKTMILFAKILSIPHSLRVVRRKKRKSEYRLLLNHRAVFLELYPVRHLVLSRKWKAFERLDYLELLKRDTCFRVVRELIARIPRGSRHKFCVALHRAFGIPRHTVLNWAYGKSSLAWRQVSSLAASTTSAETASVMTS